MSFRRLIPTLNREMFVDAMRARQWPLLVARREDVDDNIPFSLMFEICEDAFVSWIEPIEQPLVSYLELDGPSSPAARSEVVDVGSAMDEATLLSLPNAPQDELSTALSYFAIGVGGPSQYQPQFWATLMEGLKDSSPLIRKHVLVGLRYVPWAGDTGVLTDVSQSDSVADNRKSAAAWLRDRDLPSSPHSAGS